MKRQARKRTPGLRVTGTLALTGALAISGGLAGCGSDAGDVDAEAGGGPATEMEEAGAAAGGGLGQVVTSDWDWAARTDGQIEAVPFPIFSGSKLAAFMVDLEPGEPQALTLQTAAPVSEVVAFYAGELDGYRQREQYGNHTFWDGPDSFDPMEDSDVARVTVRQSISSDSTFIDMFFPPAIH